MPSLLSSHYLYLFLFLYELWDPQLIATVIVQNTFIYVFRNAMGYLFLKRLNPTLVPRCQICEGVFVSRGIVSIDA